MIEVKDLFKPRVNVGLFVAGGVLIVLVAGLVGSTAWAHNHYKNRILPGVSAGAIDLGGLTRSEALTVLETWHDQWWDKQIQYQVQDERGEMITTFSFYPIVVMGEEGQSVEFIQYDMNGMITDAFEHDRDKPLLDRFARILGLSRQAKLPPRFSLDKNQLHQVLASKLQAYETKPSDAKFDWSNGFSEPQIISEQQGNIFNYSSAVASTEKILRQMSNGPITVARTAALPEIDSQTIRQELENIESIRGKFPIQLSYHDTVIGFDRQWQLSWDTAYQSVQVVKKGDEKILGIEADSLSNFFETIEKSVNVEPQDARFSINQEILKVEQFQPSRDGAMLNRSATVAAINEWIYDNAEEKLAVNINIDVLEPNIHTSEVNDLGITEIIGVGYSNFSGSPPNRVHNIAIGAEKLNGVLIKPNEEFSLVQTLKPFTISAGYLPELVIKGDKITPEVGGGLCQIGSTTFRAAMKSGLDITQRSNHSLVVSYYNDPRNGNPGTDATIYDASPDFRFINDTGNYILFTTFMNKQNGDLVFTFWGTNDGRKADYSEPVVHRWIPAGPTRYIETTDLSPGQQKCQGAHPGASASFTYTIINPDGTVEEEVYSSQYRPLPTICLVGVDPEAEQDPTLVQDEESEGGDLAEQVPIETEFEQTV